MGHRGFPDHSRSAPGGAGIAPEPSVFDHELWVRRRRDQLGVDVIDPLGHQIGMARGINHRWYSWGLLDWREREVNWSPVDGPKHVLVGEFDSFDTSRLVAVVQDDSDRHDWSCDFDGPVPRPWSAFPRRAIVTFALQPMVRQHMQFALRIVDAREMADIVTGAGAPGLTGEFGGQPVITVPKQTDDPGKIGMGLSPVVADPDGVHLRCFLTGPGKRCRPRTRRPRAAEP